MKCFVSTLLWLGSTLVLISPEAFGEDVYRGVSTVVYANPSQSRLESFASAIGEKPSELSGGKVQAVIDFLNENANDPKTLEYIRWSGVGCVEWTPSGSANLEPYWAVRVKLRGANKVGGMIVSTTVFLMQHGQVVRAVNQSKGDIHDKILTDLQFPPGSFPGEGPLRESQLVSDTQKISDDVMAGLFGVEPSEPARRTPREPKRRSSKKSLTVKSGIQ